MKIQESTGGCGARQIVFAFLLCLALPFLYSVPAAAVAPQDSIGRELDVPVSEQIQLTVSAAKDGKKAKLSWSGQEISYAQSYEVMRAASEHGKYRRLHCFMAGETTASYTDSKVVGGDVYYYKLLLTMYDGRQIASPAVVYGCPLEKVSDVTLARYSTSSVKITWKKTKYAKYYRVYMAKGKSGKYRQIANTKNTYYRAKGLKNKKDYYFKVQACVGKKTSLADGKLSARKHMKTKNFSRTTVFAGDSITTGLSIYDTLGKIHIGGNKEVVAAKGLNTITFRTKRVFNGKSGLKKLISYHPYRVYMMLGINEIHYRSSKDVITEYKEMIEIIKEESPATDIVLLACSPVSEAEKKQCPGFGQIPGFNKKLKELAKKKGIKYYDFTGFLKDSDGNLKSQYAAADGYHWNIEAYDKFAGIIEKYDKSLDK